MASPSADAGTEVAFSDVLTFRSPVPLAPADDRGIDSSVGVWEGDGVRVLVDHGLFADPLTGHGERAGHTLREERIDGVPARVVTYERPGGGTVGAAHFPDLGVRAAGGPARLTFMAEADSLGEETVLAMVRSIRFKEPTAASDST